MRADQYAHVPSPDADAVIDPTWLELRGSNPLPTVYLPPSMAGPRSRMSRVLAALLIAVFLLATSAGVCLTYGPHVLGN